MAIIGCGTSPPGRPQRPERLVIISPRRTTLKGDVARSASGGRGVPRLPGARQIEIADSEQQANSCRTKRGHRSPGHSGQVLLPRHGVQVVENGKTVEYVICFQCGLFEEFVAGSASGTETIDSSVQPAFDKPLTERGVPLRRNRELNLRGRFRYELARKLSPKGVWG